jgi:outer membrane protein assembly factor BamE (lipoprotein component of BamABCDE complex)
MRIQHVGLFCAAFLLFLTFALGIIWLIRDDTVYAPGYSEAKFKSIRLGISREEVIRLLGQPLSVDPARGYILWTYASDDFRNPRNQGNGPMVMPAQTFVQADTAGNIVGVSGVYLNIKKDEYLNHRLEEVRAQFGDPLEIRTAPDRDLYWHSKLDRIKGHYVRFICISTEGKVCDINTGRIGYYTGGEGQRHLSWLEWLEELL